MLHRGVALLALLAAFSCVLHSQESKWVTTEFGRASLAVVSPISSCEKLASAEISAAVGAPVRITAAKAVSDAKPAAYCDVTGTIDPAIGFELRLPLANWTQRFLQTGCGGLCGQISIRGDREAGCQPATNGEFAMASTDMGHQGGMGDDGSWASADYQKRVDFAYRGVHLTTLASKALIQLYYGQAARYSYFAGCSDGGREALVEAQRFPEDFDGITAGAAAMNFTTQNSFYHGWNVVANNDAQGNFIFTADKVALLHKIALEQCDALDGLKDGLIADPTRCHVDPSVAQCKPGQDAATCFTPAQIRAINDLYAGAHTADGKKLVLAGPMPGSELSWPGVELPPAPGVNFVMSREAALSAIKHVLYQQDPPASFTLQDFAFTAENFAATTRFHALYDATDPDLSPFAAAGHKLILWHGWADQHISPLNTVAYYTAMQKLLGAEKVADFTRLYLFPGGYHCGGGEGPFDYPLLAAIVSWVETGRAPWGLIASHSAEVRRGPIQGVPGNASGGAMLPPPAAKEGKLPELPKDGPKNFAPGQAPGKVDRTRPVFPYPYQACYTGSGSIDEAKNFVQGDAQPVDPARLEWLGSSFFTPHYQIWCSGKGQSFDCKPTK